MAHFVPNRCHTPYCPPQLDEMTDVHLPKSPLTTTALSVATGSPLTKLCCPNSDGTPTRLLASHISTSPRLCRGERPGEHPLYYRSYWGLHLFFISINSCSLLVTCSWSS